jgi:MFS transporter, OFA family, oxalate/formate antiporter
VFGGPLAALLHQHTGSWLPVFASAIALDLASALLALFVLKPVRARYMQRARAEAPASGPRRDARHRVDHIID